MKNALIIGLDPGTTTGVAVLDAAGNVLNVYSKRDLRRSELISHILKFGNPIIISSDVSPLPKSVERIATKLECVTHSPYAPLSFNEKKELTKEYYNLVKNDHEFDALAASIKAWKHYRDVFLRIDKTLKKFDRQEIFEEIVKSIVDGENPNIEDSVREFMQKEKVSKRVKRYGETKEKRIHKELVERLQKKLAERQQQINLLEYQTGLLNKALNRVRKKLGEIKRFKLDLKKTEPQNELKDTIQYLKRLRKIENSGYYPLIEIDRISSDILEKINDEIDLEDRIILINNKQAISPLNTYNIKCAVVSSEIEKALITKLEFPIIEVGQGLIENIDGIKIIKKDYIERELTNAKRLGLVGWLEGYKKRKE